MLHQQYSQFSQLLLLPLHNPLCECNSEKNRVGRMTVFSVCMGLLCETVFGLQKLPLVFFVLLFPGIKSGRGDIGYKITEMKTVCKYSTGYLLH